MENTDYKNLAAKLFCFGVLGIAGFLFFKYLFGLLVPFLIAWGIAYLIYPTARELSSKIKLSRKFCSFVLLFLILMIILLFVFLIGNRILYELQNLFEYLSTNSEQIAEYFETVFDFFGSLGKKLPIINNLQNTELIDDIVGNINAFIEKIWASLLDSLGSAIPRLAGNIVMSLPSVFLVSIVTVVACFYFSLDIELIHKKLKVVLPDRITELLQKFKKRISIGFKKYLRAYLIIFAITFAELFVGFLILGIDYSVVLALLIAFVDFLPLFGTAAVLLPWGIIMLLMKDYFLGIGLLILCAVTTVVRQAIEPKILGKSLGVHPLLTLVMVYAGYELFGLVGMIILPIITPIFLANPETEQKATD